jgi:hypothetical protein
MKQGMMALVFGVVLAAPGFAQADDAAQKKVWGPLWDMAGHDYVAVHDGMPATIASFRWEKPGAVLTVNGLNSTGGTFKAQYQLDAATGRIQESNRRAGKLYLSEYKPTKDGFVEGGDQDGQQVRRVYTKVSGAAFVSINQTLVKGIWQTTRRDGTFIQASPEWVKQLGWKAKTP